METNSIHRAEQTFENPRRSDSSSPAISTTFTWLAAAVLILIGVAFELGMFGFGPYNSANAWMFSVITRNVWTMLAGLVIPELREFVRIWPIVLVILGAAILTIAQSWNRSDSVGTICEREENHAN
jgi:hypothetical protein